MRRDFLVLFPELVALSSLLSPRLADGFLLFPLHTTRIVGVAQRRRQEQANILSQSEASSSNRLRLMQQQQQLNAAPSDYAAAATALFNNMKTPASILAAGMISIGFLAPIQLPPSIEDQPKLVRRIEFLRRAYTAVALFSFCSELLAVMWATVAVNQLTETAIAPAASVWELLQRDFDLAWAAVNSHFVIGLVGFMYMVGIRGYVMLLAAEASGALMAATLCGVASALLLMVSIVNRGVDSGGGDGVGYGATVLDLWGHYVALLYQRATDVEDFGPLELGAILLELVSVALILSAVLLPKEIRRDEQWLPNAQTKEERSLSNLPVESDRELLADNELKEHRQRRM